MSKFVQRPYQLSCEQAIYDAGPGRHLVVLATGLGKTVVFTHLTGMGRTLILSHRDELVRQPEKYYGENVSFGVEKAEEHAQDEEIVSASVQSLSQESRLSKYAPDAFETIIVDEAHHAAAPTYRKILDYFSGAKRILGFTATPKRGDGIGLSCVFDDIIFSRDIRWGIVNHYLSRIRCEEVKAAYSLSNVFKTNGDYSASQLERLFLDNELAVIPVAARTYIDKCHNIGKYTLIYCVTKRIGRFLLETIRKMLPTEECGQVQAVFGDTPDEERAAILSDFQSGRIRCVINCMVLTEGTDLPICDAVLNLRPTCNSTLYQQMVGRGTRLYPGKEFCLVIDVIPEDSDISARSLCTAPSLFGIDPFVLSPSQRKDLNSDVDLLEFCDQLSSFYAERSARVELLSRDVDRFMEDCDAIFKASSEQDISVCAAAYQKLHSDRYAAASADFGDIRVEVFADEMKRYCVHPNWQQKIWVSEPDILNRVIVHFPASFDSSVKESATVSGQMPFPDALELIHMYCKLQPEFFAYCWSLSAQDAWKNADATYAQRSKLHTALKSRAIHVTDRSPLSKLDASFLIDLTADYKEAKKMSEAFVQAASGKRTKKAAAATQKVESLLIEQEKFHELSDPAAFEMFCASIRNRYHQMLALQKRQADLAQLACKKALATSELSISISFRAGKGQPASEAQFGLLSRLNQKTGVRLAYDPQILTKRQASLMISFLKYVESLPENIRKLVCFPDALDVCLSAETSEQYTYTFQQRPIEE